MTNLENLNFVTSFRPAICIFYLVLRALDTVEDDMNIPVEKKTAMLKEFHKHLYEEEWRFMESSEKDKAVLEEFPKVSTSTMMHMYKFDVL